MKEYLEGESNMVRVITYIEAIDICADERQQDKKIGLITGSFDIVHPGHVHFLQEAKSHCDILIIGLENDVNIKRVKGESRPIHTQDERALVLSELLSVDYIFKIEEEFPVYDQKADEFYNKMLKEIGPHYMFTSTNKDAYYERKKAKAEEMGIVLIGIEHRYNTSTTELSQKILKEF